MVNEHRGRVKGFGKYGVIVKWKDGVVDEDYFENEADRNRYYKIVKSYRTTKAVNKKNR